MPPQQFSTGIKIIIMANSIALTILQRPSDGIPLASAITRNFSAAQIIYFYADANTGISGATARVYIKTGKNNGQNTGEYIVSNNVSTSLVATLTSFVQLGVYNGAIGDTTPTAAAPSSLTVYYNPSVIQDFYDDANTGFTGVNAQVNAIFPKGNGTITNQLLVSQTSATIATAIQSGTGVLAVGQTTLVAGTKAITIPGVTTTSHAFVTLVTPANASSTVTYQAVCTANTLTIQANVAAGTINSADTSTLNYMVTP